MSTCVCRGAHVRRVCRRRAPRQCLLHIPANDATRAGLVFGFGIDSEAAQRLRSFVDMKALCALQLGASAFLASSISLADDAQPSLSKPLVIAPEDLPPPNEPVHARPKRTANNSIFVEGFGNGALYSVNYERILGDTNISLRAGFGYVHIGSRVAGPPWRAIAQPCPARQDSYLTAIR